MEGASNTLLYNWLRSEGTNLEPYYVKMKVKIKKSVISVED